MKAVKALLILAVVAALPLAALAGGPMEIPQGAKCYECGMKVTAASPFAAQMVRGGELLPFCDIGDMLHRYGKMKEKPGEVYVRDFGSGRWTDAIGASYVKSDAFSSPMGWDIAAFSDREAAALKGTPMTFEEALRSIR
jgi:nitrous oxide reductase accessory protein NosL